LILFNFYFWLIDSEIDCSIS